MAGRYSTRECGTMPGTTAIATLFVYDNMGAIKRLPHYVILGMVV